MANDMIEDGRARGFADALLEFEQSSEPEALARLFADDATTQRLDARGERRGEVEQFWREYLDQFREVRTTFHSAVESQDEFALEWTSSATLAGDRPIEYRGITVLGFDGEQIAWLRTYYDSAVFAAPAAETA